MIHHFDFKNFLFRGSSSPTSNGEEQGRRRGEGGARGAAGGAGGGPIMNYSEGVIPIENGRQSRNNSP